MQQEGLRENFIAKEEKFWNRDQILIKLTDFIKNQMRADGFRPSNYQRRMEDIVGFEGLEAAEAKETRGRLLELGLSFFEEMERDGQIAPGFFQDDDDRDNLFAEAIRRSIVEIDKEGQETIH